MTNWAYIPFLLPVWTAAGSCLLRPFLGTWKKALLATLVLNSTWLLLCAVTGIQPVHIAKPWR